MRETWRNPASFFVRRIRDGEFVVAVHVIVAMLGRGDS